MIIEFFLSIIFYFIKVLTTMMLPNLPISDSYEHVLTYYTTIASIFEQAGNFGYFILGNTLYLVVPILFVLIAYKYIAFPIFTTIRHFIMWGSN